MILGVDLAIWRARRAFSLWLQGLPVLGPFYVRWFDWRITRIDRNQPRFRFRCVDCGQATADPPSTFLIDSLSGGKELARHESQCIQCATRADDVR